LSKKLSGNWIRFNNMKDIRPKPIRLFKESYCTPQIARIARAIDEPPATIHYNIKKLEKKEQSKPTRLYLITVRLMKDFVLFF